MRSINAPFNGIFCTTPFRTSLQQLTFLITFFLGLFLDILLSHLAAMLLPAQPSILSVAHGISRKRSHSDALGREDTGTHYDRGTLHSTEQIRNDICGILDIRAKKNKPERILDDAIADDNTIHGDIATNPTTADSTRDSSITDNDPVDEGLIDDGIGDDESICSLETIQSGDIKLETLWKRKYPINEW